MVIRGSTRGNGKQLSKYLVTKGENENFKILEVLGRRNADEHQLHKAIESMDLMAELTKSQKGLYHAQINPAYFEDKNMDWFKAADMLGEELGFAEQRRVIVLHEKKGRTHAHVVWERYNYETGIMKSDSFSRLAQDRARRSMELEFGHKLTPRRNQQRPQLKASLNQLWHQTGTGSQFITACKNNNYMIAQGAGRTPFIVVDENGHSFNLVRQLSGIRLKDVRQRLRNETLMTEKQAIVHMRNINDNRERDGTEKQKAQFKMTAKRVTESPAHEFNINTADQTKEYRQPEPVMNKNGLTHQMDQFEENLLEIQKPEKPRTRTAKEFAANKGDKTLSEREQVRQAWRKEQYANLNKDREQEKDKGMEYD